MTAKTQRGVVLIVALVMLLIVTLLGVAAMQGARFQMKMTNNAQERQQAFNAAEATLAQAEKYITDTGFALTSFAAGCSGTQCFNSNCDHGYCFSGAFDPSSPTQQQSCNLGPVPATEVWEDNAVWSDANRHQSVQIPAAVSGQVVQGKYIIEFRCFTDAGGPTHRVADEAGDILYRITARGISSAGNAEVMVQSTYRASPASP